MCTTYLADRVAREIESRGGRVQRRLLVRLNPAVEHKTRGNAALALHTEHPTDAVRDIATEALAALAETDDPRTSPGLVVADTDPETVPDAVAEFAREALREFHTTDDAVALAESVGYEHRGWHGGRGRIGALAAVGAWRAFDEWTYEHVSYRVFDRCGTPREVDHDSVFAAAESGYPEVWDTVDRAEGESVCVPHAPGPILHGVRGDDPDAVRRVASRIDAEPVAHSATFVTNQGTDAHLRPGEIGALRDGRSYRVDGVVSAAPETRAGGHVHLTLADEDAEDARDARGAGDARGARDARGAGDARGANRLDCVAFEPTKRFRDRVRALRVGDRLTVCGEVSDGTLKLEKFAVRESVTTELATPVCPDCDRTMESAGRGQGYRCRDCGTSAPGKTEVRIDRDLETGWYEVPPCARRHVAKPLIRGGFDAPTHPER
nr:tRNA(Ile)(2)-agmatinylcytidine synthase [Salinirubrum litoreum]